MMAKCSRSSGSLSPLPLCLSAEGRAELIHYTTLKIVVFGSSFFGLYDKKVFVWFNSIFKCCRFISIELFFMLILHDFFFIFVLKKKN
jgi:hypothetical protein